MTGQRNDGGGRSRLAPFVIPLCSALIVLEFVFLDEPITGRLSFQNITYLMAALTVLSFAFLRKSKNVFDWLVIAILVHCVVSGPLKAAFYNFTTFYLIDLFFHGLLLLFVGFLLTDLIKISKWYIFLVFAGLLTTQLGCFWIIDTYPSEWLYRKVDGVLVFDFFSFEVAINSLIQSLAILIPSLIIIQVASIRTGRSRAIHPRTAIEFSGVFFVAILGLIEVFFVFERYLSPWTHALLHQIGFIPLVLWYLAFRCDEEELVPNNRHFQVAIHGSVVFLLLSFSLVHRELRTLLVLLATFIVFELIFILFTGIISLWTEVHKLGRQIREMGEYLARIWDREEDGVLVATREGGVVDASDLLTRLHGETVAGKNVDDFLVNGGHFSPEHYSEDHPGHIWLSSVNGRRHPITVHSRIFEGNPESLMINIIRDQEKFELRQKMNRQMQEQLLRERKLESLFRMGEDIGHNFNNFLQGIAAYSEMIRLQIANARYEQVETYLTGLRQEISRASAYVLKIIDAMRADDSQMPLIEVRPAVENAIALISKVVGNERYRFDLSVTEPIPRMIGNSDDLTDLLFHIVWNAVEAMPKGGVITIGVSTRPEAPGPRDMVAASPGRILITVSDRGGGISDHIKEHIFDPFFSTKGKVGQGLGLTIAYALVKRHKGTISWSNNPDRGVTFVIDLPAAVETPLPSHLIF